jgi:glutamyl-tRNA synthetase
VDWDEGPFYQSQGLERHRTDALNLLDKGLAFKDFSTPEEAAADREEEKAAGKKLRRARTRADALSPAEEGELSRAGRPFTVRFRVPKGETVWEDGVHGTVRFRNEEIDDLVILRSDGTPTYNLAVVSDDVEMRINLVLRGDDHLSNTPKQILLYQALGKEVPEFAHVPLILGPDGKRLSKRHGATAVGDYEGQGILPEAMFNFLCLLGWSPGDDKEVFSVNELVDVFSLERVLRKSSVFDLKKLQWLNGQHLAKAPTSELEEEVERRLSELGMAPTAVDLSFLIDLLKVRSRTLDDLVAQARPYLREELEFEPKAVAKHWSKDPEATADQLESLMDRIQGVPWEAGALEEQVRGFAEDREVGLGKVIHPLRLALTGLASSPGIFDVLLLLGKERSMDRVKGAISMLRSGSLPETPENKTLS